MNALIRAPQIRVIDAEGEQRGIMTPQEALKIAELAELDLVEVAPTAKPPVCRVMDYSKYKYDQAKKEKEAKKKQKIIHVKEIKLHPRIDQHDYAFKKDHMEKFLKRGDKVKVTMVFRGREKWNTKSGMELMARLTGELAPMAEAEGTPVRERNQYMIIFVPKR